ncbi:hypothetical protein G9A89_002182 [Geosiphon pyriformis]|nr:hypothetical protein G9A89_002182 [Geosiphon pyriformis]
MSRFTPGLFLSSFLQFLAREFNLLNTRVFPEKQDLILCDNSASEFDRWNDGVFFDHHEKFSPDFGPWELRMSETAAAKEAFSLNDHGSLCNSNDLFGTQSNTYGDVEFDSDEETAIQEDFRS